MKIRITQAGQPCRHCDALVIRQEHSKPPKYKAGGYFYEWWLRCPKCGALYMQESAKRFFDQPGGIVPTTQPFTREEIENQTGDPPW